MNGHAIRRVVLALLVLELHLLPLHGQELRDPPAERPVLPLQGSELLRQPMGDRRDHPLLPDWFGDPMELFRLTFPSSFKLLFVVSFIQYQSLFKRRSACENRKNIAR